MSDDGERTCPLCTEEMDLTDQQLKPCKCGYEICVWCWHHIIDMAEKEDTEGRCPACRTPYDKERIVGMATKSERLAAEATEKKQKSQKLKPKTSVEAKKHLNSVRVIQRNLVYIIGLPSNLCEESILERKEYFGQYGKVLKVSISRPTSAPSQQTSNNNTLSVYITYAKEAEAIRCIQAVHNYVLEGKSLRACFGTTKYCHAWLKNMICSNPDCLYLHDIGSQEDSFTKDEIISAYTRVPQFASTSSQRRYGNVLPPPMDEFLSSGSKNQSRSTTNSVPIQVKGSPENSGKSTALPAAASWGHRSANCHSLTANVACSQPIKQKAEAINHASSPPLLSKITNQPSAWHDEVVSSPKKPEVRTPSIYPSAWDDEIATIKEPESKETLKASGISQLCEPIKLGTWKGMGSSKTSIDTDPTFRSSAWKEDPIIKAKPSGEGNVSDLEAITKKMESLRPVTEMNSKTYVSDVSSVDVSDAECASEMSSSGAPILVVSTSKNKEPGMATNVRSITPLSNPMSNGHGRSPIRIGPERVPEDSISVDGITQSLNSNFSAASTENYARLDQPNLEHHQISRYSCAEFSRSQDPSLTPHALSKDLSLLDVCGKSEVTDRTSKPLKQELTSKTNGMDNPLLHYDNGSPTVSDQIDHLSASSYPNNSQSSISCLSSISSYDVEKKKISAIGRNIDGVSQAAFSLRDKEPLLTNGYKDDNSGSFSIPRKVFESPEFNCTEEKISSSPSGRVSDVGNHNKTANLDVTGESNIISDILSLDFDPWDDSLFSSDSFTRFLGETGKQEGSFNLSSSLRSQSNHQSRFSFARQESQPNISEPLLREENHAKKFDFSQDVYKKGYQNGMSFNGFEGSNPVISTHDISFDRSSGMSKVNVSAPPGFTAPSRVPPPGFSPQDRFNQTYDTSYSDNHLSSSVGNHYQAPSIGNSGDVEFIDPAILAIGKEPLPLGSNNSGLNLKYTFPAQFSTSYSDPRFQLLMQQSISSQQNLRMPENIGDRLLPLNDSYITSRLLAQSQNNLPSYLQMHLQHQTNSHFTNSQWDGRNDVRVGNDIGMSDIFRSGRFGLNNYYPSNEEHKFHIPAPDVYNRAFGL